MPMNGKYLLDTNIIIALFAEEQSVLSRIAQTDAICISNIVLGELYYGARKSTRVDNNIRRIDEFATVNTILECDQETSTQYGQIKYHLRAKGRPIPENDIWLAAQALQHQLTLVSRDDHFLEVDELLLINW